MTLQLVYDFSNGFSSHKKVFGYYQKEEISKAYAHHHRGRGAGVPSYGFIVFCTSNIDSDNHV
jgi:hypothetical protein